ncbi:hypothetical protein [Streptomyces sp. NPDC004435]|uniref:hypothetical protein n=1 Tax=Streptomyces sp. NPDC004435 TaxID=3364701 RepID=UPI003679BEFC
MQKPTLPHALMDVVPESGPVAIVLGIAAVIFGPPLGKLAWAFWSPKIHRALLRVARSFGPEVPPPVDDLAERAVEDSRQQV